MIDSPAPQRSSLRRQGPIPSGRLRPSSTGYGALSRGHGVWVPALRPQQRVEDARGLVRDDTNGCMRRADRIPAGVVLAGIAFAFLIFAQPAAAGVEDFYKGRTVSI